MGFMSDDIQPRAPVASSTASAILPVLFCGKLKAWMICASVKAQLSGVHKRLARENNRARKMNSGMRCGDCIRMKKQK
jgi:hypothetical protein